MVAPFKVLIHKNSDNFSYTIDIVVDGYKTTKVDGGPTLSDHAAEGTPIVDMAVNLYIKVMPPIRFRWKVSEQWLFSAHPETIWESFSANEDLAERMEDLPGLYNDVRKLCTTMYEHGMLFHNPSNKDAPPLVPEIITEAQVGYFKPFYGKVKDRMPEPQKPLVELCPAIEAEVKHPVSGIVMPLGFVIMNLNDHCGWDRGRVADWLETLDVDINIEVQDDAS
jgi:hypothetical protein